MRKDQKQHILVTTAYTLDCLQKIEAGTDPVAPDCTSRRLFAHVHLAILLKQLVAVALPKDLREAIQPCLDISDRIWTNEYYNACQGTSQHMAMSHPYSSLDLPQPRKEEDINESAPIMDA